MFIKQALLIAITVVCFYFIFFGQWGFVKFHNLSKEIDHEKCKITKLEKRNKHLNFKIDRWLMDNFEKEKFARTNLQMSCPDEMVFVLTQT